MRAKPPTTTNPETRLYFTTRDIAAARGISLASARVLCSRRVRDGRWLRLKNNFYVPAQNWPRYTPEEKMAVAGFLQVPSYVSLLTALSDYGITTQRQRDYFECVSLKRSVRFEAGGTVFEYYKIKPAFYSGFGRREDVFIASAEKAFLDAVYFYSFGKYRIDFAALDVSKLDRDRLKKMARPYPAKTRGIVERLCRI